MAITRMMIMVGSSIAPLFAQLPRPTPERGSSPRSGDLQITLRIPLEAMPLLTFVGDTSDGSRGTKVTAIGRWQAERVELLHHLANLPPLAPRCHFPGPRRGVFADEEHQ